jgi:hypothetical protein
VRELIVESHAPIFDFDYATLPPLDAVRKLFELSFDTNLTNATRFALDQMMLGGKSFMPSGLEESYGQKVTRVLLELIERGQRDKSIRDDADALFLHLHMWMLNVAVLSSRPLLSRYIGENLLDDDFAQRWRAYASKILAATLSTDGAETSQPEGL